MKPACHLSGWRVNTDTPMYKKTKFSARKLPSSNSCKIMHTAAVSQEKIEQSFIKSSSIFKNTLPCQELKLFHKAPHLIIYTTVIIH